MPVRTRNQRISGHTGETGDTALPDVSPITQLKAAAQAPVTSPSSTKGTTLNQKPVAEQSDRSPAKGPGRPRKSRVITRKSRAQSTDNQKDLESTDEREHASSAGSDFDGASVDAGEIPAAVKEFFGEVAWPAINEFKTNWSSKQGHRLVTTEFKEIEKQLQALQSYKLDPPKADAKNESLLALSTTVKNLSKAYSKGIEQKRLTKLYRDLYKNGLPALFSTFYELLRIDHASLLDPNELETLILAIALAKTIDSLLSTFGRPKEAPEGLYETVSSVRAIKPRFGLALTTLQDELQKRIRAIEGREAHRAWVAYLETRKEMAEREAEERRLRRVQRVTSQIEDTSPILLARTASPPHDTSLAQARVAASEQSGNWTEEMDDELLQGLSSYVQRPLEQRYNNCLARPALQHLMPKHIQDRALELRPTLIAWYEKNGDEVPQWVTSIEQL